MIATVTKTNSSIAYSARTVLRAETAMRCAPFSLKFYATMLQQSVGLQAIAGTAGVENHYTTQPQSELSAESTLMWLIQVGLLRREVDGQGLTDSFRLTPLGRQLVEKWQPQGGTWPAPSWLDRLKNSFNRWFRLPF